MEAKAEVRSERAEGRTVEFKLPSGIVVKKRPSTLSDIKPVAEALNRFKYPQDAAVAASWLPIGQTIVEFDGKPGPVGWDVLSQLSEQDGAALMYLHKLQNEPDVGYLVNLRARVANDPQVRQGILQALDLARLQVMPFPEAMALTEPERKELYELVGTALGIEAEAQKLKGSKAQELKGSKAQK